MQDQADALNSRPLEIIEATKQGSEAPFHERNDSFKENVIPCANRDFMPGQAWHITHRCYNKEIISNFLTQPIFGMKCSR